jgi:hypothetical protein
MNTLRRLVLSTIVFVLQLSGSAGAQEKRTAAERPGLALEVMFLKGMPPAFQAVSMGNAKATGGWFARFGRIPGGKSIESETPVRAVRVISRIEEEAIRIDLSVYVGAQFFDKELPVASYLLKETERVTVAELTRFGVEPFEIAVVRVAHSNPDLPPVVNNSSSLEVVSLEPLPYSLAWYQLTMRNLSNKTVALVAIDVFAGNRLRLTSRPQGQRGDPLVEPGAVFSCKVKGVEDVLVNRYNYESSSAPAQSIVIKAVVFADGSYEGDAEPATHFKAQTLGRRVQLIRIVALLRETMEVAESGATDAIAILFQKVSALSFDVQPSMFDDQSKSLANLDQKQKSNFRTSFQYSLHSVRKQLLDEIEEFQKSQKRPGDGSGFRAWLAATNEQYNRWLSSCERVTTL